MSNRTAETVSTGEGPHMWVLIGWYSDKSGCKLLGLYEVGVAALDRKKLLEAAGCNLSVQVVKMKVNAADPQEVF
jgi:hypothetical protein